MSELILPTIGSSGFFQLRSPFDTKVVSNERYTCQAIRRLSDYIANNEDPKSLIYVDNGLPEDEYDSDSEADMYVVSLQSEKGHWLYVPARYILTYPIVNGIPYRTMMLGVALPALPADRDLSFLQTDISNLIKDSLGVDCVVQPVETSRVILVSKEKHDLTQSERNAATNGKITDRSRYMSLLQEHQSALQKIAALENYIKANHT